MDFHGKFSAYRMDTTPISNGGAKLDFVVALCTPTLDGCCNFSREHVWAKTSLLVKYVVNAVGENTYLDYGRNQCVNVAKETAVKRFNRIPDYYLWLDQDNVFPDDLFFRLRAHDKDIVSASYVRKGGSWDWVFKPTKEFRGWEGEGRRGLIECDYIGFGAVLVKGKVFEELDIPWFKQDTQTLRVDGKPTFREIGEDVYFCEKVRKLGYKCYVDTETHVGHMGATIWPKDGYMFHKNKAVSGQSDYLVAQSGMENVSGKAVNHAKEVACAV